jgi:hypothetical protein
MNKLHDTYVAALQHGHVEPDEEALVLGVMRQPMWASGFVDRNDRRLAPPQSLLDEFHDRQEYLEDEKGQHEITAQNRAFSEILRDKYIEYLDGTPAVGEAIGELLGELAHRDVWLVCFENTEQKRCHRTILKRYIERQR